MSGLTQKQIIDLNRTKHVAIYFLDGKRILTYGPINKMTALEQQLKYQRKHNSPITMILLPEDAMTNMEYSLDMNDYYKYLE